MHGLDIEYEFEYMLSNNIVRPHGAVVRAEVQGSGDLGHDCRSFG
jgi:hypothetical protein